MKAMLRLSLFGLLLTVTAIAAQNGPLSTSEKWMRIMDPGRFQDEMLAYDQLEQLVTSDFTPEESPQVDEQSDRISQCQQDMNKLYRAATFKMPWALKYMDSWGGRPSGLLQFNLKWYGDFDECLSNKADPGGRFNITFGPRFCIAALGVRPNGISPIKSGVCVSENCDAKELAVINQKLPKLLRVNIKRSYCVDPAPEMDTGAYVATGLFSFVGLFLFIGLLVDVIVRIKSMFSPPPPPKPKVEEIPMQVVATVAQPEVVLVVPPPPDVAAKQSAPAKPDAKPKTCSEILLATVLSFSPLTNFIKMFKPPGKVPPGLDFSAANGIRALSLFWVMLAHQFMYSQGAMDNMRVQFSIITRWTMQFVLAGIFAVDTFFLLSGFFGYYSMAKLYKKKDGSVMSIGRFLVSVPKAWLLRYLRLTPPYAAIILISAGLWPLFWNGPFYFGIPDQNCVDNWWIHLLYLNNWLNATLSHPCVSWSWYMPVDFQMYLVSPFFIYALVRWPIAGWLLSAAALVAQIVTAAVLTVDLNLPCSLQQPIHLDVPFSVATSDLTPFRADDITTTVGPPKKQGSFFSDYYVKPYMRMGPFIVGMLACHLLMQHEKLLQRTIFSRKWAQAIGWFICLGLFGSVIYGQYGTYKEEDYYTNPPWANALFNAFGRIAWGLAVAWIIMAAALKHGGIIGNFLSWPYWAIAARLSYCSYLVNPMVIDFYVQTLRRPLNYTDIVLIFHYVGTAFITLMVAALMSLCFESPMVGLLAIYLK